jgi:hypothetical protein
LICGDVSGSFIVANRKDRIQSFPVIIMEKGTNTVAR